MICSLMPKNINAIREIYIFLLIGSFHNQVYHRTLTCLKKDHPKIAYLPNLIWTEYFFQQICDLTALHIFNPIWASIDLQWYWHQPSLLKALYSQDIVFLGVCFVFLKPWPLFISFSHHICHVLFWKHCLSVSLESLPLETRHSSQLWPQLP